MGDTARSVALFLPETVLCGTILLMLTLRVFDTLKRIPTWLVALFGVGVALFFAEPWNLLYAPAILVDAEIFTGLLVCDSFTMFFRGLLLVFTLLFILLTRISGIPDREDAADFYTLVLGAVLGMTLMSSANHLLIIFLSVEMASVPSFVLAGILKGRRQSSEAALKYAIYGAGAAGVMLYGISLLAGVSGSCHIPTIAARLSGGVIAGNEMALALGGLMIMVGLAFKLSAVPFHFWCPDVFEGAAAEVGGFLSVASKAGALALLVRVAIGFSSVPEAPQPTVAMPDAAVSNAAAQLVSDAAGVAAPASSNAGDAPLEKVRGFMIAMVALLAGITCTFGNLAAYGQTNIKRLLAYSTIAHAGYMMMAVVAALTLLETDLTAAQSAISALLFYLAVYLFMNLGAFAIVAFLRNAMHSEQIDDYAGLVRTSPGVAICFAAILFSLVGLPPLAGFLGKFEIFLALVDADSPTTIALLVVGGLNTAVSLFYYLRVVKVMTIDEPIKGRAAVRLPMMSLSGAYVAVMTLPILLLIVQWDGLNQIVRAACEHLIK